MLRSGGGVPLDLNSNRQPLLANCPAGYQMGDGSSVNSLFDGLATIVIAGRGEGFSNYNEKSQLKEHHQ
mgnify:FL=1